MSGKKKKKWTEKAINILYSPHVRKLSRFAANILETTSLIDTKNPISLTSGIISVIDSGVDAFDLPLPTKIEQYGESHGLIERISFLARVVVSSGLPEDMSPRIVCLDGKIALKELEFDFGNFYYVENIDGSTQVNDELDRVHGYYYTTKDFPFELLFEKIWEKYPDGIYLSIKISDDEGTNVKNLRMHSLATSQLMYIGDKPNLDKFCEELNKYRAKNISRSYMLIGAPGTGKTSYAVLASNRFTKRILKIDPGVAQYLGSGEFDFIIRNLHPDVIIFDDFDEAAVDSKHLLFALEMIKQQFPNITIFATVNNFEDLDLAIRRPGRIDKRIWFELPTDHERQRIALHYLKEFGVEHNKSNIDALVADTENMSPAYIRELCVRLATEGWEELEDIIEEFRRTLSS